MRQLQQTVERLAIRVSVASTDIENEKCSLLQVCSVGGSIMVFHVNFELLIYMLCSVLALD